VCHSCTSLQAACVSLFLSPPPPLPYPLPAGGCSQQKQSRPRQHAVVVGRRAHAALPGTWKHGNQRRPRQRPASPVSFHPNTHTQNTDRSVEIFRIRTAEELKKKLARKEKRRSEKGKKGTANRGLFASDDAMLAAADGAPALSLATMAPLCRRLAGSEEDAPTLALSDEFVASPSILAQGKVRSLAAFCTGKTGDTFTVFTSLANNAVEEYHLKRTSKEVAHTRSAFLALPGHRKPIRCGEEGRWSPRRPLFFFLPLASLLPPLTRLDPTNAGRLLSATPKL